MFLSSQPLANSVLTRVFYRFAAWWRPVEMKWKRLLASRSIGFKSIFKIVIITVQSNVEVDGRCLFGEKMIVCQWNRPKYRAHWFSSMPFTFSLSSGVRVSSIDEIRTERTVANAVTFPHTFFFRLLLNWLLSVFFFFIDYRLRFLIWIFLLFSFLWRSYWDKIPISVHGRVRVGSWCLFFIFRFMALPDSFK